MAVVLPALSALGFNGASVAAPDAGAALYKTKCAACHGADGKGATTVGKADSIRDLGSADVQGQTDAHLNAIITNGKGKMPGYGKSMKPEQVTSLVAYIRSIASK
jgi:cytochrome c6